MHFWFLIHYYTFIPFHYFYYYCIYNFFFGKKKKERRAKKWWNGKRYANGRDKKKIYPCNCSYFRNICDSRIEYVSLIWKCATLKYSVCQIGPWEHHQKFIMNINERDSVHLKLTIWSFYLQRSTNTPNC